MTPAFGACPASPNVSGGSGNLTPPQTLNYYIINIAPAVGVRELENDRMSLSQNFLILLLINTDITFYVEGEDDATVTVYNMLGDIVNFSNH